METTISKEQKFSKTVHREKKTQTLKKVSSQTILYIILTVFAVISVFPFIFMIFSSLMSETQYNEFENFSDMIPRPIVWENYYHAFTKKQAGGMTFSKALLNTLIVAGSSTFLSMILLIVTAFAFARLEFKGKNIIFSILLATMMIPGELFTITNYVTVTKLGLQNTLQALIWPFMVSVYYIYLLRNNFKQIPEELYKAAKVDGVSDNKYLWRVMVPLASPTLISIFILKIISVWNSYIWPQLINKNRQFQLLSNWMASSGQPSTGDITDIIIPIKMAAAVIITLPLLILFIFFRKYIMRGVSRSGIKG